MIRRALAVIVALAASVSASAGNLMLGPTKFDPSYGFQTSYEDNIYRVPADINHTAVQGGGVRGSWIFTNDLGLQTETTVAEGQKLDLGYDATFENYTTQSAANDAINQKADAAYSYEGSKTKAQAYDHYINTHDPQFNPNGTGGVLSTALVTREARWDNNAGAMGEYYLGDKFFAGADFDSAENRYLDNTFGQLLNTSVVTYGAKGGYKIEPKTSVFVSVHEALTHYSDNVRRDNHRDTLADLGVEGDLTAKLKGTVQAGYTYQGYDYSAVAGRQTVARNWNFLASLDYRPTSWDDVTLTANRANVDAATTDASYYVTSGFNLGYNHTFTEKITAGVNGGVQWDQYSDFTGGNRRDDNYQAGARVDYKVCSYLTAGATYLNNDRFSTFSRQFSYRDNITGVNAKLAF